MISAKPTEHLTGVNIEGEYLDFFEIVEAIYRIVGVGESPCEDYSDPYWGVKNRLLGMCYDIRHASMGDRELCQVKNGINDEILKWHSMIVPKQNVHFCVDILFPEAVFVALSVQELYLFANRDYGKRTKRREEEAKLPANRYSDYIRDQALLDGLRAAILQALADVIGDDELENIMKKTEHLYTSTEYYHYLTQYVDKCNIEYLKTAPEKRKDKIRNIAKRLASKPSAYKNMEIGMKASAREYNCSIHELYDPKLEYPEDIEW